MRILIHGINFAPELVGVGKYTGEMAGWLASRGHEVRVVTAPPFNPQGKVFLGYSSWRYAREQRFGGTSGNKVREELVPVLDCDSSANSELMFGLSYNRSRRAKNVENDTSEHTSQREFEVIRCPLWVSQKPSTARRMLHLTSFALSSLPAMLCQVRWKPDIVVVLEPTFLCVPSAWITARLSNAKAWLHIQDFEIDAGFELGLLQSRWLQRSASWLEKKCLSKFDRVSTISEKMMLKLLNKGVEPERCVRFPNWVDTSSIFPLRRVSPLRSELGISQDAVVALYSGTMAQKQGLEILIEAARILSDKRGLQFVFCGDGPDKGLLKSLATRQGNVLCLPLQPYDRLNDLLNLADIHLLPQKADAADLVMPSKLAGMLASGHPIVATAQTGTQIFEVVNGRGLVVPPGDASAFAAAISKLADDPSLRENFGGAGRAYSISELEMANILSNFEEELHSCSVP